MRTEEAEMAAWMRLTDVGGHRIDVNMDQVKYVQKILNAATVIVFATATGSRDAVQVTETPDEILSMRPPSLA